MKNNSGSHMYTKYKFLFSDINKHDKNPAADV